MPAPASVTSFRPTSSPEPSAFGRPDRTPAILTARERAELFDPPSDHDEAARRYSLASDELALTNVKRRDHNRLGFAVQLALVRDRTAETMSYRASGLNLVVNAIVLWNTVYLARAVAYVRSEGVPLTDEEIAHVAPIKWSHIALTGDYLWSEVQRPRERFRPLRTRRFDPNRFATP